MTALDILPTELQNIIAFYASEVLMPYKIAQWVEDEKIDIFEELDWMTLSFNPRALELFLQNRQYLSESIGFSRPSMYNEAIACLLSEISESMDQLVIDPEDVNWFDLSSRPLTISYLLKFPARIDWRSFCRNTSPDAIQFISENLDSADWYHLSANPAAAGILAAHQENIDWNEICRNTSPYAVQLISENMDRVTNWTALSANPAAVGILLEHRENIVWAALCRNTSPAAIELLQANLANVDWTIISGNESTTPEFLDLLELGVEHLDWYLISKNAYAIGFLEAHLDKIDFSGLSENPAAVHILKNNMDKVDYANLCDNPSMFEPDLPLYHKRVLGLSE